jgi:hypothetical protein
MGDRCLRFHLVPHPLSLAQTRAIFFNVSVGTTGFVFASEISTLPLRPQTQGIIGFTQSGVGWLVGFVFPYCINPDAGNLGGKVAYIFFGFGVILSILTFLYLPETKGLSIDEVTCFLWGR